MLNEDLTSEPQTMQMQQVSAVPQKSADIYERQYDAFMLWCESRGINNYTEEIFLTYFSEKSKNYKSSTLWSTYSMLKTTILVKHNLDISKYKQLLAFIREQNIGYKPKKSNIFTREDINRFLTEAPDLKYLMWKVCLVFGVAGACRMEELKKMSVDDIQDVGNMLLITIPDSRSGKQRTFTVSSHMCDHLNPIELYRQYIALRPGHTPHKQLFIFYRLGKCSIQRIGIHTFGKIPSLIATYLNLPEANTYTGHAFRRTSTSLKDTRSVVLTCSLGRTPSLADSPSPASLRHHQDMATTPSRTRHTLQEIEIDEPEFKFVATESLEGPPSPKRLHVDFGIKEEPSSSDSDVVDSEEPIPVSLFRVTGPFTPLTPVVKPSLSAQAQPLQAQQPPIQQQTIVQPQQQVQPTVVQQQQPVQQPRVQQSQVLQQTAMSSQQSEEFYEQFGRTVVGYLRQLPRPVALQCQQKILNLLVEQCMAHT